MEQRIKVLEQGEELQVEIKAFKDDGKHALLRAWMVMWTLAGLTVLGFLATTGFSRQEYLFIGIYMAFWAYFEYKIVYVFRWRSYGIEKINVKPGEIQMTRLIKDRGIPQTFKWEDIEEFERYEEASKAGKVFGDSYWVVSNPAITFIHHGRTISLGNELEEKEASRLFGKIKKYLKG